MVFQKSYSVVPATNSYHSETLALHAAVSDLIDKIPFLIGGKSLCFLSDSKSLVTHLQAARNNLNPRVSGEVLEIIEGIRTLQQMQCQLSIVWIPGHIGIPGNDIADKLAGIKYPKNEILESQLQYSMAKNWVKNSTAAEFQSYLSTQLSDSQSNSFAASRRRFLNIMNNPTPGLYDDRHSEVSLYRIYAGHCNVGAHWLRRGRRLKTYNCRKSTHFILLTAQETP